MIAELETLPGEVISKSPLANRTQGRRAVGGRLHITNQRLAFVPHGMEKALAGRPWSVPLGDIVSVDVAPRGWNLFNGSTRRRLRITTRHDTDLFVVNRVKDIAAELSALISQPR